MPDDLEAALACRETNNLMCQCRLNIGIGNLALSHPFYGMKGEPNVDH